MDEPLRVLVVDDSADDALLLAHALRGGGYAPVIARVDTADAMREALREPWDVILADYTMPRFSGPAALRLAQELGIDLPFIMVSGKQGEETAVEVMRAGAHDYVMKSNLSRLAPAVARELREAALRAERQGITASLERERAFFTSAIELLPFPIIFNDLEGRVLRANRASYTFFGTIDPNEWWSATLLSAETRVPVPRGQWPMMRAARGEVVPAVEGIMVLSDGREVPVLSYSAPVYLNDEVVATVVAFQEISALKEADRAKDRFLAVLSHELRTPLSNILGWVKEARVEPALIPQALEIIQRNAETQQRMLQNLLDVSRLLHGKLKLRMALSDLWTLAEEAADALRAVAELRHITLALEPPPAPLPVRADAARLREVLVNVLDNALKYTDPDGTVTLRGEQGAGRAALTICDTGHGMSAAQLETLFKLFALPERPDAAAGLHLSMGLAKAVVEMHDGRITASSPGLRQGATVHIELPLAGMALPTGE
ncbi:MAG TPA: ATP-binding protein [Armatimonadota bacterium]|nr:ATP-binding protein [Armatimonadota bacterium]